jgi:hypothetical protein
MAYVTSLAQQRLGLLEVQLLQLLVSMLLLPCCCQPNGDAVTSSAVLLARVRPYHMTDGVSCCSSKATPDLSLPLFLLPGRCCCIFTSY